MTASSPTATSAPTATATGAATANFGVTNSAGTNDYGDYNYMEGAPYMLATSGTLQSLSVYVGATPAGAHLRLALYTDAAGSPGTVVAQTGEAIASAGWNNLPLSGGPVLAPGTYWILAQTDNVGTVWRYQSSATMLVWHQFSYGSFPAAAPTGWSTWAGHTFDMYGTVASGPPPPTATATNTPTATATGTATSTPTNTPTMAPTATATSTPTVTPTPTVGNTPTAMPTPTVTSTPTLTPSPAVTNAPTVTPTVAPTTNFGVTNSAGTNDYGDANYMNGSPYVLNVTGTLASLSVYVGATPAGAHLRLGLYADASGGPGTLVAQTGEAIAVAGWDTLPVTGAPAVTPGTYWIIAQTDNNGTVWRYQNGTGTDVVAWHQFAYGAFPASAPTGWGTWANKTFDMYGTVTTAP